MLKRYLTLTVILLSAFSASIAVASETILRLPPLSKPPRIDGSINHEEWSGGSRIFGGISQATGYVAWRDITFYIAYDSDNIYLGQKSVLPTLPMTLVTTGKIASDDSVAFILRPPGSEKEFCFEINSAGRGNLPAEIRWANSSDGKYWETEIAVPFSTFGVTRPTPGSKWGLQIRRLYQNPTEDVLLHLPGGDHLMASLFLDKNVLATHFEGLGARYKHGGYEIRFAAYNPTDQLLETACEATFISEGPPHELNVVRTIAPGATHNFDVRVVAGSMMAPRTLSAVFEQKPGKVILFQRNIVLYTGQNWVDPDPPVVLDIGVYPSFDRIKGRIWCRKAEKLDNVSNVEFRIEDSTGQILERRMAKRRAIDFFKRWELPELPEGKYFLTAELTSRDGKKELLKSGFEIKKFIWEGNDIGKERVIVPPFTPLKVDQINHDIHALQTGYRLGNGLWDRIYALGENILAEPVKIFINGAKFTTQKHEIVRAEPDRVVAESKLQYKNIELDILHEYDYDGMCKVSFDFIPKGNIDIESLFIDIPLKAEHAKLFHSTRHSIRRNPSRFIPMGEGVVWGSNQEPQFRPGNFRPYLWFGDIYKGISWFCETENNWSLNPQLAVLELRRSPAMVTLRINVINQPCKRNNPFRIVMGFQPTPVKPQPEGWRKYSIPKENGWVAPNSIGFVGSLAARSWQASSFSFFPMDNDYSYIKRIKDKFGRNPQEVDDFIKQYIKKYNLENSSCRREREIFMRFVARRSRNADYILPYFNPRASNPDWPEYDTYADEWQCHPYRVNRLDLYYSEPVESYRDMMLYYLREMVRNGADGIYFDNVFEVGSIDPDTGAIEIAPERYSPQYTIWGMRELIKRTATMLYLENKTLLGRPLLRVHMTNSNIVPFMSFAMMTLNWENHFGSWEYHDRFSEEYILAECLGTQTGTIPNVIAQASGENVPWLYRTMLANMLAYDLMQFALHQSPFLPIIQETVELIRNFGYGDPEVKVYPGWNSDNPVKLSRKDVKATVLVKKDAALLLIGDLGQGGELELDVSGLKFDRYCAVDLETNSLRSVSDKININLKKRDFAIIRVENSSSPSLPEAAPIFQWVPENADRSREFNATPITFELNANPKSFTFAAWAKPAKNEHNKRRAGIVSRPGFHTKLAYDYQTNRFLFATVTGSTKNNRLYTESIYPESNWHFVAGVFDADNKEMRIYVDGKEQGAIAVDGQIRQYPETAFIGCSSDLARNTVKGYFYGAIGEVTVYNHALNNSEIEKKYDILKKNYLKK